MAEDPLAEVIRVVDAKAYGASGDGVTDDTAAFQAAITDAVEFTRLDAEVDRLRAVVQALEEECAARQEAGNALLAAVLGHPYSGVLDCAAARYESLTARYALGGPDPLPDPVEGDSKALRGQP